MAGNPTEGIAVPRRTTANFGIGSPDRSSAAFTTCLRRQSAVVQLELPLYGRPSSSITEITAGSSAATPSIDSQRLKTKSARARRSRSIQRASGCTGMRTTVFPSVVSDRLTASTVPMISWSGDSAKALAPSKRIAIFTRRSRARRPGAPPLRRARRR